MSLLGLSQGNISKVKQILNEFQFIKYNFWAIQKLQMPTTNMAREPNSRLTKQIPQTKG